jgi:hypothetical protein
MRHRNVVLKKRISFRLTISVSITDTVFGCVMFACVVCLWCVTYVCSLTRLVGWRDPPALACVGFFSNLLLLWNRKCTGTCFCFVSGQHRVAVVLLNWVHARSWFHNQAPFSCENFWKKILVALFVVIWQNLSNHGLSRLKRFVSTFTNKLYN